MFTLKREEKRSKDLIYSMEALRLREQNMIQLWKPEAGKNILGCDDICPCANTRPCDEFSQTYLLMTHPDTSLHLCK